MKDHLLNELERRLKNLQASSISVPDFYAKSIIRIINNIRSGYYSSNKADDDDLMRDLKSVGYHDLARMVLTGRTI